MFNLYANQLDPMEVVTVEQGILRGSTQNKLAVFKGIPFAKPPVGELRWQAPKPADKWQGIKKVTEFAAGCMQGGNPPSGKSEDCLYLNVWTPAQSATEKLPVMVWIYGGGFSFGATSEPMFNGVKLTEKGVIFVSIAYRVGQLGFLAHPELSAESEHHVSGNYGLLDQIAALKWIKQNIAQFGGNPDNITIFGESAGAISVSMLAASPLTKGLFDKAISQSGGSFGPTRTINYPGENMSSIEQAQAQGLEYVKSFGVKSIAELRKMDAQTFIPKQWSMPGGWPIVDGYVIPDDQFMLYQQGKFNDVKVMAGYNSDEGASFVWDKNPQKFIQGIQTRFGPFAPQLIEAYSVSEDLITRSARNLIRDVAFGWHSWSWARLQTQHGQAPFYLYFFDQHPVHAKDSPQYGYGSPHAQDIGYVFQQLDPNHAGTSKSDLQISEAMASYWTNFAKTGNPNGDNLTLWPAFNHQTQQVMLFQQTTKVAPVPDRKALTVMDEYFKWRRTEEGKSWANKPF
ncbi:carboxylesterase family protein [Catenovulum sp. 2E275]|uniref:carboxylesterase/lipase family protein n=1 Tax=Catenovulum sp. 2E275 TaxID=2980497 RepID=UPI0021D147FB|nr:carboxylesterase family protein [Catenovulum sp. 2E275]MCU4674056.1 carboxylesterase family protein [Catenovulum sp. 2E275]